jgi:hypothetical protein
MVTATATEDRHVRVLAKFVAAVADGRIGVSALVPLDAEQIREGWRRCVAALQVGHVTQDTLTALQVLHLADPSFGKAHFLLGLACSDLGLLSSARAHFQRQLDEGDASVHEAVRDALAALGDA